MIPPKRAALGSMFSLGTMQASAAKKPPKHTKITNQPRAGIFWWMVPQPVAITYRQSGKTTRRPMLKTYMAATKDR